MPGGTSTSLSNVSSSTVECTCTTAVCRSFPRFSTKMGIVGGDPSVDNTEQPAIAVTRPTPLVRRIKRRDREYGIILCDSSLVLTVCTVRFALGCNTRFNLSHIEIIALSQAKQDDPAANLKSGLGQAVLSNLVQRSFEIGDFCCTRQDVSCILSRRNRRADSLEEILNVLGFPVASIFNFTSSATSD